MSAGRSSRRLHSDRRAREAKAIMFAHYGRVCHLCGHGGATDADLVVPRSVDPEQPLNPRAYRPAHGVRGCPTCGRKCNQERGAKPIDAVWTPKLSW